MPKKKVTIEVPIEPEVDPRIFYLDHCKEVCKFLAENDFDTRGKLEAFIAKLKKELSS